MSATARRRSLVVGVIVALVVVAVWRLWPDPEAPQAAPPAPQTVVPGSVLKSAVCHRPATHAFVPTRISVPGVTRNATVEGLPRDANDVPSALPVSAWNAKISFAWDEPTIKPGEAKGNVLINAHTWPDGTALGNHLLDRLQVGHRIIVRGKGGAELCYKVTKRIVIRAADGSAEYYAKDGPPQIALIVCSPPRLGPGNWQNRTIWFASPVGSPQARAVQAG
ncbi:class F sortase [Marmoricola sp. RAF53]|uniref:class F sortase n=1 Tax=Marmoricola sp. RAF53 TaxID=3233059 RepID=UPI003F975F30